MNIDENKTGQFLSRQSEEIVVCDDSFLPVTISDNEARKPNQQVISEKYYNSFNFSKLSSQFNKLNISIGVTSANKLEGKTRTASNMAVSLARGYQRLTLIVDMNFRNPQLHNIFGVENKPGLAEALANKTIKVAPSSIENLFVMPAGDSKTFKPGIEHTLVLRDVFESLKREFDFIIVDMSSVHPVKDFPINFINEIDGLISVIDTEKTKKTEFNNIFKHIDEKRFVGYVFNNAEG